MANGGHPKPETPKPAGPKPQGGQTDRPAAGTPKR